MAIVLRKDGVGKPTIAVLSDHTLTNRNPAILSISPGMKSHTSTKYTSANFLNFTPTATLRFCL